MKNVLLILFLLICISLTLSSCNKGKGNISGNVYWKYNDFVGNKPDAGSSIFLINEDTTKPIVKAVSDVNGNFEFTNIECGNYLLVSKSKNTRSSLIDVFESIDNNSKYIKYTGINLYNIDSLLYKKIVTKISSYNVREAEERIVMIKTDSISRAIDEFERQGELVKARGTTRMNELQIDIAVSKKRAALEKIKLDEKLITFNIRDTANNLIEAMFKKIPSMKFTNEFEFYTGMNKVDIRELIVEKDKTNKTIIDFGITYF